ncbi:SPOR domain-containing protein [Rhizobium sp. S-51]|uniref:SPOR domain-containing protein n=1 Tax=Rhizobium terricola TaxID=2728849 RepID=A0A7Y0FUX6_9HYPH|nr:SPOR domain-containing protein [Rhizobium terricola]NML73842.1 SPOR domain-containing protein [Rhizobium terricola]
MVQKQAAFGSRFGQDSFADDDPLAELARIVGFEPPVERSADPVRQAEPEIHQFNLEDELMREFDDYDAPPRRPIEPVVAEPVVPDTSRNAEPAYEDDVAEFDDVFFPEPVIEPRVDAPVVAAAVSQPAREEPSFSTDLADELELAVAEQVDEAPWRPVEAEPRLRLPLANFAPAPVARVEPPMTVPAPVEPVAPSAETGFAAEGFLSEADFDWPTPTIEAAPSETPVAEQVATAPAVEDEDPFALDALAAITSDRPAHVVAVEPVAARPRSEPSFNFSFADDLAADEDFSAGTPVAPVQHAPTTEAPQRAEPRMEARASIDEAEFDPFSEGEFDIQLDDIELDLSDIEEDFEGSPVPSRNAEPAPAVAVAPAVPAVFANAAPAFAAARSYAPVAPAPAPSPAPVVAREPVPVAAPAPVRPAPQPVFSDEPLAFDPSEISEQDDHLESIAGLDVPEVPQPEAEAEPVSYSHDYDLDIDSELASLFDEPSTSHAAVPAKPAVSQATPTRPAAPVTPAAAPAPAPAASSSFPPMDDFDAFERALEEDFRHTLSSPSDYASQNPGRINIPVEPKGLSRFAFLRPRNLLMAGTATVAVLLAGGAIYAWLNSSGSSLLTSGEPPVIAADKDPVKVVPEDKGGKAVPNQDKAVYDSVAGAGVADPKQESLISSSEEPVDVVQKTLIPETLPLEGENDVEAMGTPVGETEDPRLLPGETAAEQPAAADAGDQPTITPRKVRTMIVRPDGTLVAQEAPEEPVPAPQETAAKSSAQPAAVPAQVPAAKPALAAPSNEPAPTPVKTTTVPVTPAAPATETAAKAAAPVPTTRPPEPAKPAVAEQTDLRPAAEPVAPAAEMAAAVPAIPAAEPAAAAPAPAAGSYFIQVASLPSQAEAEKSYKSISGKFASVVGGRAHEIKKAEIAGKGTYYRVRIAAGSKADAAALCERYKSAGGSCLVTK